MASVFDRKLRSRNAKTNPDSPKAPASGRSSRSRGEASSNSAISENKNDEFDKKQQDKPLEISICLSKVRTSTRSKRKLLDDEGKNGVEDGGDLKKKTQTKKSNVKRRRRQISSSDNDDEKVSLTPGKRTTKKIVYTERRSSRTSSESNHDESASEIESGMASSYSSASAHEETDSPIPTSDLSDSSKNGDTNSDESSGSEDLVAHKRKSPRKVAQAKSRKKIAELRDDDDEESSDASSGTNYSDDET